MNSCFSNTGFRCYVVNAFLASYDSNTISGRVYLKI